MNILSKFYDKISPFLGESFEVHISSDNEEFEDYSLVVNDVWIDDSTEDGDGEEVVAIEVEVLKTSSGTHYKTWYYYVDEIEQLEVLKDTDTEFMFVDNVFDIDEDLIATFRCRIKE